MNIAIFGGSFNPVHNEHINVVKAAIRDLSLDKVIVMPTNITPFKGGRITAPGADRLNMCRLAFKDVKGVEVSDYELKSGGVSYSYLTCREMRKKYPEDNLCFIMGADMLKSFPSWKYPEEILKCVTLAVCAREKPLETGGVPAVQFRYTGARVSSTRIRTLAALGADISEYVTKNTADYILQHGIYTIGNLKAVKKYLTEERYAHTLRVALTAVENCRRLDIDESTALIAAALHDCAKYLTPESPELKGFVCPGGVPKPVVHQYAGAYVAEHTFGIKDADILNAIRYHTSGRPDMSNLEKLIYLADMLEEGRNFEGVDTLREIFERDIDGALYAAMKHQINYLKKCGEEIYPLTLEAYSFIKEKQI